MIEILVEETEVINSVISIEWSAGGEHRICSPTEKGKWAYYRNISKLHNLHHTTDYYKGVLPKLFNIEVIQEHA